MRFLATGLALARALAVVESAASPSRARGYVVCSGRLSRDASRASLRSIAAARQKLSELLLTAVWSRRTIARKGREFPGCVARSSLKGGMFESSRVEAVEMTRLALSVLAALAFNRAFVMGVIRRLSD